MVYVKNPSGLYCCIDTQTYTINNKPERSKRMNKDQPQELVDLQEKLSEIFWYVKSQAKLARHTLTLVSESSLGDLDETERRVHKQGTRKKIIIPKLSTMENPLVGSSHII